MKRQQLAVAVMLVLFVGSSLITFTGQFVTGRRISVKISIHICGQPWPLPNHTTPFAQAYGDVLDIEAGRSLGDFFNFESEQFNSSCIYGFCNDNRCPNPEPDLLKMWVHGVQIYQFDRYVPRHGDVIVIDYSSGLPPTEELPEQLVIIEK